MVQLSHPYMTTGKTIALTIWTFFGKVMSLIFNPLSRFVIAFLPRSKHLLISWLQSTLTVICSPRKEHLSLLPLFPLLFAVHWQTQTHTDTHTAAAAAKSLQSCPTPCDPTDCSPPGSAVPGILQARTLEWVAISFSNA